MSRILDSFEVSEDAVRALFHNGEPPSGRRYSFTEPTPRRPSGVLLETKRSEVLDDGPEPPASFEGLLDGSGRRSLFVHYQPRTPVLLEVRISLILPTLSHVLYIVYQLICRASASCCQS